LRSLKPYFYLIFQTKQPQ